MWNELKEIKKLLKLKNESYLKYKLKLNLLKKIKKCLDKKLDYFTNKFKIPTKNLFLILLLKN